MVYDCDLTLADVSDVDKSAHKKRPEISGLFIKIYSVIQGRDEHFELVLGGCWDVPLIG